MSRDNKASSHRAANTVLDVDVQDAARLRAMRWSTPFHVSKPQRLASGLPGLLGPLLLGFLKRTPAPPFSSMNSTPSKIDCCASQKRASPCNHVRKLGSFCKLQRWRDVTFRSDEVTLRAARQAVCDRTTATPRHHHRFLLVGLRSRTPGPPPFSSMNWIPPFSKADCIRCTVASRPPSWPSAASRRAIVGSETPDSEARSD